MAKKLKIENQKKRQRWRLLKTDEEYLTMPIKSASHIEMLGNSLINIDGCLGVYEYSDTYLKIKLSKGSLILCGNGFDITYFENSLITVKGEISSVEFCV